MCKSVFSIVVILLIFYWVGPTSRYQADLTMECYGADLCDVGIKTEFPNCTGGNSPPEQVICKNLKNDSWRWDYECFHVQTHRVLIDFGFCNERWAPIYGNLGCTGNYDHQTVDSDCTPVTTWCDPN